MPTVKVSMEVIDSRALVKVGLFHLLTGRISTYFKKRGEGIKLLVPAGHPSKRRAIWNLKTKISIFSMEKVPFLVSRKYIFK